MPCTKPNAMSLVTGYDVIVVGAGPAGSEAARAAATAGLRTLLVEEHPAVGIPNHCTGKLSVHAFSEFDLPDTLVLNSVSAAIFHSPGGVSVHLRRSTIDSHVVDRIQFDRWLVDRAANAGAEVLTGVRIAAAVRDNGTMVVRGERTASGSRAGRGAREFLARCRFIIDAEGAAPRLPKALGIPLPRRQAVGLQYQMRGVGGITPDTPEIFFGDGVAPGFFAWLMPLGGSRVRVGLCVDPRKTERAPVWYLERLLATHPALQARAGGAVVEYKIGGRIPLAAGGAPVSTHGFIVAGDAAGQVKATSGGGIYYAMIAGRIAGQAAAGYMAGDSRAAAAYESRWRERFGREVSFTAFGRRAINRLSDRELDIVLGMIAASPRIRSGVEAAGDTQFQSRVFLPLLRGLATAAVRQPLLLPVVGKALLAGMLAQV
jgi:geranylgeranyl reductase family protein